MWIVLLLLIALLLIAIVWIAGLLMGASLAVLAGLSAIVLILAACVVLGRYLLRLTTGRGFEKNVVAEAQAQIALKPDRRNEILALQAQFQQGIAALKQTKLGRQGGSALYAMPWFVIVGPPGAGKTTAIRHSGLEFPIQQGAASAYRGFGGTRNCDWWFTNEAILLDTAGRYSVETDDQQEWFSFLDLLRKSRPRRPVDGLLVAISIMDIIQGSDEQIAEIAKRIRGRCDEIASRLQMKIPVYVLFTKLDLLTGFVEMFNTLKKSERGQVWGSTFANMGDIGKTFEADFDEIVSTLLSRLVRQVGQERQVDARRKMSRFVVELEGARHPLRHFMEVLFAQNTFQESQIPRGFYFTSGTQEGRPSARLAASMLASMNLPMPAEGTTPRVEPKSYFLTDLFRRVVFADKEIGGRTEAEKRRQLTMRVAVAASAALLALTLLLPGIVAFAKNQGLVSSATKASQSMAAVDWKSKPVDGVKVLDDSHGQLVTLDEYEKNGAPIQLRWGMYTGDRVAPPFRRAYTAAVEQAFVSRTHTFLRDRLASLDSTPIRSADDFSKQFDDLKLYLMLTDPQHVDPAWAAPRLVRVWTAVPHTPFDNEETALLPHALYYLEIIARNAVPPLSADRAMVTRARSILSQVPQRDRLYDSLIRDANAEIAPIRREAIFHGSIAPFVQSKHGVTVDGAYTRQGWERIRALLGSQRDKLAAERWVLGETDQGHDEIEELRTLYFDRYRATWKSFLVDLAVQDPGNAEVAIDELTALSEPEWPYLRLIKLLNDNVSIEMEESSLTTAALDKAGSELEKHLPIDAGTLVKPHEVSPVERAFKPILLFGVPPAGTKDDGSAMTGLAQYQQILGKLVGILSEMRDAGPSGDAAQSASTAFQEAFRSVNNLLAQQDGFTRPLLSPLLMQPITYAWSNVVHDAGAATGAKWESQVWQRWHDTLDKHYPFDKKGSDAALNDFVDFFAPESGALFSFYDESLKTMIDQSGNTFTPSRRFKVSLGFSPLLLDKCLKRGSEISTTVFPPKSETPAVVFDVNLHSVNAAVSEVTFEVDGVSQTYRNEPQQWLTITWPGKSHGARLKVKGAGGLSEDINRPGDFGLFHLLDSADVKVNGRTIVATWELKSTGTTAVVKMELRPQKTQNPFDPAFFANYDCPRSVTGR